MDPLGGRRRRHLPGRRRALGRRRAGVLRVRLPGHHPGLRPRPRARGVAGPAARVAGGARLGGRLGRGRPPRPGRAGGRGDRAGGGACLRRRPAGEEPLAAHPGGSRLPDGGAPRGAALPPRRADDGEVEDRSRLRGGGGERGRGAGRGVRRRRARGPARHRPRRRAEGRGPRAVGGVASAHPLAAGLAGLPPRRRDRPALRTRLRRGRPRGRPARGARQRDAGASPLARREPAGAEDQHRPRRRRGMGDGGGRGGGHPERGPRRRDGAGDVPAPRAAGAVRRGGDDPPGARRGRAGGRPPRGALRRLAGERGHPGVRGAHRRRDGLRLHRGPALRAPAAGSLRGAGPPPRGGGGVRGGGLHGGAAPPRDRGEARARGPARAGSRGWW